MWRARELLNTRRTYSFMSHWKKVKTGCEEGNTIQLDTVGGQDAGVKDMPQILQA